MINLDELSKVQKVLRDRIDYKEDDRFEKLVLAFIVELGELANEARFFKFWAQDQEMRREKALVEYVDNIHFLLDIGLALGYGEGGMYEYEHLGLDYNIKSHKYDNLTAQFLWLSNTASIVWNHDKEEHFELLVMEYLALGEMLGFSWGEVTKAYMDKNKENHIRQDSGY